MKEDKRFYTFVFAPTAKSQLRKINVPHNVLYAILGFAAVGLLTVGYGAYRLAQHAVVVAKLNLIQSENRLLREKNQEAQSKYDILQNRLAALDTTQRKLAEASGLSRQSDISANIGQGGPDSDASVSDMERVTAALESELRQIKDVFDKNQIRLSSTPSGWPVRGYITDGFGDAIRLAEAVLNRTAVWTLPPITALRFNPRRMESSSSRECLAVTATWW